MVEEHNKSAASLWSEGGRGYDYISFSISDALSHVAQSLWPKSGENILDIATGTGWSARNVAYMGANVTGVDIAEELLAAAKALSSHIQPAINYQHADAENLPFDDKTFDGVISTFGIMFAGNHQAAADELVRVCKPGGRISLATWLPGPDSFVARMFGVVAKHNDAPSPKVTPLEWGRQKYVNELLGDKFDLEFREEISTLFSPGGLEVWNKFHEGFGPVRLLANKLDEKKLADFKKEFIDLHEEFKNGNQIRIERRYLLTTGVRT